MYKVITSDNKVAYSGDDWLAAITEVRRLRAAGTECQLYRKTKD